MFLAQFSPGDFESLGQMAILAFIIAILLCIGIMIFLLWLGWWVTTRQGSGSPYTGLPMKRGEDLTYGVIQSIQNMLARLDPTDNPPFDLRFASICRETGRIFPDSINMMGAISLGWDFLNRRCKGNWVSWGSLTIVMQAEIRSAHDSMEGFQTEVSSPDPIPQKIDSFHAMTTPGPLYVDIETKTLMGWKTVPHTPFEILIVQRPYYQ